jgi:hypothetical protein
MHICLHLSTKDQASTLDAYLAARFSINTILAGRAWGSLKIKQQFNQT